MSSWGRFFDQLGRFLTEIDRQSGTASEQYAEYVIDRLSVCSRSVGGILDGIGDVPELESVISNVTALLDCLSEIYQEWQTYLDDYHARNANARYRVAQEPTIVRGRGRPKFVVTREQLQYLHSLFFSWTEVAQLLGVSRMTVYRRRLEYGMLDEVSQSMTQIELHRFIQDLRAELPNVGVTMVWGRLRSLGFHIPRQRVREAVRASDPLNTALRWPAAVTRRPYSVPGPNSLWHIDGHHKLIRWRFVTHGAIDGYSRAIVFLKCSTNNRSATVYEQFLQAIREYGLPSRVRTDHGLENVLIAAHMLRVRGLGRGSMITGSSTHNQRIERLWKDMHRCATLLYYRLFYFMEQEGILDCLNEIHLFSLHYIYLPRINRSLSVFRDGWNNHGIRTEHHLSPRQLFVQGLLRLHSSNRTALDVFDQVDDSYGIDYDEIAPPEHSTVNVPESRIHIPHTELMGLQQQIDPLQHSDNYGIELYVATTQFLESQN